MSTFGVYVALCLPRKTIAIFEARRPSVWPVASTTYHSRWASPASLVSQKLFCIIVISGTFAKSKDRPLGERIVYKVAKRLSRHASTRPACSFSVTGLWYHLWVRVGFILKPDKTEAGVLLEDLVPWLVREGHVPVVTTEDQVSPKGAEIIPEDQFASAVDLVVVLGGDGTILRAARLVADVGRP